VEKSRLSLDGASKKYYNKKRIAEKPAARRGMSACREEKMKFWKNAAHIRMLLFYLLISAVICGLCFYTDLTMGIVAAAACLLFTVLRLAGEAAYDARVRSLNRCVEEILRGEKKPVLSAKSRGALHELDSNVFKLALKLSDSEARRRRAQKESELLLRGMAAHLVVRAEELPANVHKRELIALAHDMEHLADLEGEPIALEEIGFSKAADIWQDAIVLADETLRLQQIRTETEISPRAHVTTCPRDMVTNGLRGLLETCARHAEVGSLWLCSARETPVFTEFRISSAHLDWDAKAFPSLFDHRADAEPALIYLAKLAMIYHGEVRAERDADGMSHLILRLYRETR
jgi:hypothetical protein